MAFLFLQAVICPMLLYEQISTPIGPLLAYATTEGTSLIEFIDNQCIRQKISATEHRLGFRAIKGKNIHILKLNEALISYFNRQPESLDVELKFFGTDFQISIWEALRHIPFGRTFTYAEFSEILGIPKGIRAVAAAIAQNPIPILVPCHRVVGASNKLVGYSGGLWRKHWLLKHETGRSTGTGEIPFNYDDLVSVSVGVL